MAAAASAGPGASGSVRGRFPGRPWVGRTGSRADRARVPFQAAGESPDPAQLRILGLHLNMKRLAGACGQDSGDSDSTEDEFMGFSGDEGSAESTVRSAPRSDKGESSKPKNSLVTKVSPTKLEFCSVDLSKTIFTPEKVIRVHLTPIDPSMYGLGKSSIVFRPSEKQEASKKQTSPLPACSAKAPGKGQKDGVTTSPGRRDASDDAPKARGRPRGSKKMALTPRQRKRSSLRLSPAVQREEAVANESTDSPLREIPLSQTKSRASRGKGRVSAKKVPPKTPEKGQDLSPPAPPQATDVQKPRRRSGKAKASDLGNISETDVRVKPSEPRLAFSEEGKRVSQVPKVKWKLRAGYRQVSELEMLPAAEEQAALERGGDLPSAAPAQEPTSPACEVPLPAEENAALDIEENVQLGGESSVPDDPVSKAEESTEKEEASEVGEHQHEESPMSADGQEEENNLVDGSAVEELLVDEDAAVDNQEPAEVVSADKTLESCISAPESSADVPGEAPARAEEEQPAAEPENPDDNNVSETVDLPNSASKPFHRRSSVRRRRRRSHLGRSQNRKKAVAQRYLSDSKDSESKAQAPPPQSSKTPEPAKSGGLKNIRSDGVPLARARPPRVIKTPQRFMYDPPSPPTAGLQAKPAPLMPDAETNESSLTDLDPESLSDALPSLSDPCLGLFNDEHLHCLLPPLSPRTDSTPTCSSVSSAASSPSVQSCTPTPNESKRKNILRAPTFCWNSFSVSAAESLPTASPPKPLFRLPSPGSPEEPLQPGSPASAPPSPLTTQISPKLESVKRSPILRAPQFTPSEAHLKIYQSVSLQDTEAKALSADLGLGAAAVAPVPEVPASPCAKQSDLQSGSRRANHLALPLFVDPALEKMDDDVCDSAALVLAESSQDFLEQSLSLPDPLDILNMESPGPALSLLETEPGEVSEMPLPDAVKPEPVHSRLAVRKMTLRRRSPSSLSWKSVSAPPSEPLLSGTDQKVISLLEKAKRQLIKIDKQKSAEMGMAADSPKDSASPLTRADNRPGAPVGQCQDSPLQGPRIKHVSRHPAMPLGQPRAMIPEDIPRLSALPPSEREADVPSAEVAAAAVEDTSSASEPESRAARPKAVKAMVRRAGSLSRRRLRMGRCGACKGCEVMDDCGKCVNCLDKTKFGGPNTKKQCCVKRRCELIEARRQERVQKKGRKVVRAQPRRDSQAVTRDSPTESDDTFPDAGRKEEADVSDVTDNPMLQRKSSRRCVRQRPCYGVFPDSEDSDYNPRPSVPRRKQRKEPDLPPQEPEEPSKPRRNPAQPVILRARKGPEQESVLPGGSSKSKLADGTRRLRVDFKEDCDLQNVWLMGGLSVLTSFPVKPSLVCLLCASRGRHKLLHCQVCCEPFHPFCLEPSERPLPEQEESWCCRRCKFCNVCGRKGKSKKPLLQCELCQANYHVNCLGPNYPVKPPRSRKGWICSACVRCKSCGASPAVEEDAELSEGKSLCTECTALYEKGNFCPICIRCYEENDYESQMIQCVKCDKWVHSKCEGLSDEGYEILSNLPDSVVYTCPPCLGDNNAMWREAMLSELAGGLQEVVQGIMTSKHAAPLLRCTECSGGSKCPRSPCDLQSLAQLLEGGHYSSISTFNDDLIWIIQNKIQQKSGELESDGDAVKSLYLKLMEKCFSWFRVEESKHWGESCQPETKGVLPKAVMPPSSDHTYACWRGKAHESPSSNGVSEHPASPPEVKKEVDEDLSCGADPEEDNRQCVLCLKFGDDDPKDAGRLLYIGQNEWTHINCAIWSAEVFEENDGSLKNVHAAVARGRQMRCEYCSKIGATVGCCLSTCLSNFHFMCARASRCNFQDDKKVFCLKHKKMLDGTTVAADSFDVLRRVYVDFEGISFRRKFLQGLEPENVHLMIGSMKVDSLGMLSDLSVSEGKIYPVGYECSRLYWSTLDARRRCWYKCRVLEHRPRDGEAHLEGDEDPSENRTIVHSPLSIPDAKLKEAAFLSPGADTFTHGQPPSLEPATTAAAPRFFSGARIKTPNYSPSRRPLGGSRPLPSPGSPSSSPLSHHILTVSDPEVTPLRRTRRPAPPARLTRQSSGRHSKDSTSPVQSPPTCQLTRPTSPKSETPVQLVCGAADVEVDGGLVTGPLQCGAQLVVGTESMADESEGASSSEEENGERYYELTRTVVSKEPFSPLLSSSSSGRIQQLDGIHDSTDSEDGSQGPRGIVGNGKAPSHLPSDIADFVLKNTGKADVKASSQELAQPALSAPDPSSSSSTQNGNSSTSLSNGTDCAPYPSSKGPPPLRDPPQLQRVCHPPIAIPQSPLCPPEAPMVTVFKPESKIILVNKTGPVILKSALGQLPIMQQPPKAEQLPNSMPVRAPAPRPIRAACKTPMPSLPHPPQPPRSLLPPLTPSSHLNTVFLQATASSPMTPGQSWTLRGPLLSVLPMLNVVQSAGHLTLGGPALMTPTITSIPQTCLLQGVPVSSGLLGVAPAPVNPSPQPVAQAQPPLPLIQPVPTAILPLKRPCTSVNGNPVKKLKAEKTDGPKAEKIDLPALAKSAGTNLNSVSRSPVISRPKRARIKAPMLQDVLNLDSTKEEQALCNELFVDLTVDVKVEDSPHPSPKESPCSEGSEGFVSGFEDFYSQEEENQMAKKSGPHLRFEIISEDGFYVQSDSAEGAWKAVLEKVQEARGVGRLRHLSYSGLSGARMLGIRHDAVLFLLEQLIGAERCRGYKFLFHPQEVEEEELPTNPSGCARSEFYVRKSTFDMFNFLASQHRTLPEIGPCEEEEEEVQLKSTRRATSLDLPMAMRFRHLKKTSKEAVGVYRSAIHGRGLFCKRNIDAGEMVIEYSGIVIRSVLTDKREKYYDGKGIGCYMFRIDDFDVVDATMHGNAARFINHSCEPNCYSRVIHVEGQKHIVIFALRSIYRGEELTYDYKFPIEDANNKLPCNCGAKKCRRFLN
ncbi:histone-lysine N-methyltransferase 2B [Spea bombifrons]|uniref:histone-lysine N-methyltransferase 2B n=1 Tax=Spea bombifrons TaxID=233779 RepID=UPI0023496CAC|nr:histone-lysine N-methyltransferase 2B [Spea bombifrons]